MLPRGNDRVALEAAYYALRGAQTVLDGGPIMMIPECMREAVYVGVITGLVSALRNHLGIESDNIAAVVVNAHNIRSSVMSVFKQEGKDNGPADA